MNKNSLLISTLVFAGLTACGPLDDMKDMKNQTKELGDISKAMSQSTKRIEDYSSSTYRDMRLDTSVSNGFKALREMENANSLEQKAIAAAYYMASFEFQLWKNKDLDNDELREHMAALSVKRLFADIKEYNPRLDDSKKLPPETKDVTPDDDNLKNLYALAATLHEINPNQEAMAKVNKIQLISMLDLITDGLVATASGKLENALPHQKIVAQNVEYAVLLLQLRFNVMAGKSLTAIADTESEVALGKMAIGHWQPDLSRLNNSAKVEQAVKLTKLAIDTRERLVKNGFKIAVPTKLKVPVSVIFKNMDLSNVPKGALKDALTELNKSF
jgi:hypothetical protein